MNGRWISNIKFVSRLCIARSPLEVGYRIDFLVENCVIVEVKAVEKMLPLHVAQLLSLSATQLTPVGLLINFNVVHLRQGIRRGREWVWRHTWRRIFPPCPRVSSVVKLDRW